MNWDQIEGKWKQFAGSFREEFGKFTDNDIDELNGRRDHIVGKLQERYGHTKEEAERRLHNWSASLDTDAPATADKSGIPTSTSGSPGY
jgi:uncharacterized protein YjbJ (UPF0337 family)